MGNELLYDHNLALAQAGGESALAAKLLKLLLGQLSETQVGLEQALNANDSESIRKLCHGFAGASSYCGVPQLTDCAKIIEQATDQTIAVETKRLLDLIALLKEQHRLVVAR